MSSSFLISLLMILKTRTILIWKTNPEKYPSVFIIIIIIIVVVIVVAAFSILYYLSLIVMFYKNLDDTFVVDDHYKRLRLLDWWETWLK